MRIRLLVMDVDGTLTDGKIYMGPSGEMMKAFDIKDGYAIREMLPKYGIVPAIITGRSSEIVEKRARELGIDELHQGKRDKRQTMLEIMEKYHCAKDETAYIGDDILDICCMEECGMAGCPSDASDAVKAKANYICKAAGGNGAVREFILYLID